MKIDGWKYYNHAAIPTVSPHDAPDTLPVEDGRVWKIEKKPLLARWTTDFDCNKETNWWYVIKDTPFDISELKAKRRYEINKGIKNFNVIEIAPSDYKEELYNLQVAAFSAYPEKYRPSVNKESFFAKIEQWKQYVCVGGFDHVTNELCGYSLLLKENGYIAFEVLKTNPQHEKRGINAALVEGILKIFETRLINGEYICDGSRSINHETAFQDYLEKYFGFRKAYCKLHIAYNPKFKWVIKLMYPMRKLLLRLDGIGAVHSLNSVLRMEEICRNEET